MSVSSVKSAPIEYIYPSKQLMFNSLNSFLFKAALVILSLPSSAFGSTPNSASSYKVNYFFDSRDSTGFSTNEIAQCTLNYEDYNHDAVTESSGWEERGIDNSIITNECTNFAGKAMLCSDHLSDSYIHYKTTFMPDLRKLLALFQKYEDFDPNSFLEDDFHKYISIDRSGENAPQKMPLKHVLHLNNGALYQAGKGSYEQISGCEAVSKAAKEIIQNWHPGEKIEITGCEMSKGEEKEYRTHLFHVDQRVRALLNIPDNESPMIEGDTWMTKTGEKVKLHKVSKRDGKMVVSDLKYGERKKIPLGELIRPENYTPLTTQIVPGLAVNFPENDRTFSIPETTLTKQILMKHLRGISYPSIDKLKSIVSLLQNTSVAMPKGPYLIPVSKLMHGFAIGDHTKPPPLPKSMGEFMNKKPKVAKAGSKKNDRWLLTVNYRHL